MGIPEGFHRSKDCDSDYIRVPNTRRKDSRACYDIISVIVRLYCYFYGDLLCLSDGSTLAGTIPYITSSPIIRMMIFLRLISISSDVGALFWATNDGDCFAITIPAV